MKLILNNPYRTVGLLVGATAKEQNKQIRRLKQFIEADQNPEEDFSFQILGDLNRTVDSVSDAASKLTLDSDKIDAALFWFFNGNAITDEPAFDALKDSDVQSCSEIWAKLTSHGAVTQRNSSAFQNLSTLILNNAINGSTINADLLEQGISLKLKFLESDFTKEFKESATDTTFKSTKKELQHLFLSQLQAVIEKNGGITSYKLMEILNKQEFSAKENFLNDFIQKPIKEIEKQIEECKTRRKDNKANAISSGNDLYKRTAENLDLLKSILGITNIKFSSISDKVSGEILQSGIEYFLHYKESNTDPGSVSMDLFRKAKSFAIGNIAKQRCQENTENLQEWINDKPEREKESKIIIDFQKITKLIDENQQKSDTIVNAKQLLAVARPLLYNIKSVLGHNDQVYLGLSLRIASEAQGMCIAEINKLQERFSATYDNAAKMAVIILLKQKVNEAYDVNVTIGSMDLNQTFRNSLITNRNSLSNLKTQFASIGAGSRSVSTGGSSGCYIATMAYGDYNHPQVMILREFRDTVLDTSIIGKWFIKSYYHYSPKLVEKLKDKKTLNSIIRKSLNQFIKLIK